MLMNNLDPEVAERPDDLVVYGGTGRAARSWEAYDALVRTLSTLEGDRHSGFRLVRATKNRFGPADEVGCFEMAERGIVEPFEPSHRGVGRPRRWWVAPELISLVEGWSR